MGIGAGWYEHEWRAYGYGFPDAPARLRMLREGVEIFRQAWTTGSATLDGEFYKVDGALVRPLPLQEGGIPMWVAGGGEKVTLKIAAQYASYTNFNGGPEEFAHKSELLRAHCETVGTDFDSITRSSNFTVVIDETEAGAQSRIDRVEARLATVLGDVVAAKNIAQFRQPTGDVLVGTPAQILDVLEQRIELGLGYTITNFPESAYDRSGVELFETEVLAKLR
jgi:alkanesulfonate monooxygenase SsuD/methylene tetrahydromethanopterin reductase-like flavin-dependent oxidoreductase (luciferase family)